MSTYYIPSTLVVRRAYAQAGDSFAHEEARTDTFDRWLNRIRAEAWEQGAFAAATSLDHGGHNADNPYKETP